MLFINHPPLNNRRPRFQLQTGRFHFGLLLASLQLLGLLSLHGTASATTTARSTTDLASEREDKAHIGIPAPRSTVDDSDRHWDWRRDDHHHARQQQDPSVSPTWQEKYGSQFDMSFSGPLSFAHLNYSRCLEEHPGSDSDSGKRHANDMFDIAILGMPFDTAVTYRPGARFGPYAIRSGSRRQHEWFGYSLEWGMSPYTSGVKVMDCGDVPISPFDNALALDQMEVAYSTLLSRAVPSGGATTVNRTSPLAKDGKEHPRIITLGGDHTIVLPILRSLYKVYGPISVIHFDSHLDTWPGVEGSLTKQSQITHGTYFYTAQTEGLLANNSVHGGIRTKLTGPEDLVNDENVGFQIISAEDIDDLGMPAVIKKMRDRIGDSPVYLSLDIDVIDPGMAPATGTPEAGGWTTREMKRIIRGLSGLNFVGADVVEVSPSYDHAEITGIAAANVVHDMLSMMIVNAPPGVPVHRRS